jgi:putative transposase
MTQDIDELAQTIAKTCKTQEDFSEFFKQLKRRGLEAALSGELTHHLGYDKHAKADERKSNSRNGYSKKTIQVNEGEMEISIPRDRTGTFEPEIIPKYATRFDGLDEKIISFYARGMSTRDIQSELEEIYGTTISPTLISSVTDAVLSDVRAWQARPLDSCFPIVYLDGIVVKVKTDKGIINKCVYLALGVNTEGYKELLGMWISQNEGAKFWLNVLTDIKNRGLDEIFIACVDGLTGFPEAIETVYPHTKVQLCIVHKIRNSLAYVSWKDRKILAADLKTIYSAKTLIEAEMALDAFSEKWDDQYPSISASWRRDWMRLIPFFDYPADIRRAIYTTNAIESLNMTLRKVIKNKRMFPTDEAVFKLLYLAIERISQKWTMPIHNWKPAMNRFMIEFGDRVTG